MVFERESWPRIIYGTAWKEAATSELTRRAIDSGYRAIDTANQPRHYDEPGVGNGVEAGRKEAGLERADVFLQTKFTPLAGQGSQVPYERHAALTEQASSRCAAHWNI